MAESDELQRQVEPSPGDDRESLLARHRKEAKELRGIILVRSICKISILVNIYSRATCTHAAHTHTPGIQKYAYTHTHTARVQALKRSVPKGNKSRKKEVDAEIAQLEEDLRQKQKREIADLELQVHTKNVNSYELM